VSNYYNKEFLQQQQVQEHKYQSNLKHQLERIKNLSTVKYSAARLPKKALPQKYTTTSFSEAKKAICSVFPDNPYDTIE